MRAGWRATPGATPTRSCARSSTRSAARLGGDYRVLVDANQHVDREAAARSGVGFYGKNTMLITRRTARGSCSARSSPTVELEPTPPLDAGLRRLPHSASTRARPARSTSRGRSTRRSAFRTGRRRRQRSRSTTAPRSARRSTAATSARTSARGTAASRSGARRAEASSAGHVDLVEWLERCRRARRRTTTASTCRATTRASCAATRSSRSETSGGPSIVPVLERHVDDEHARWAHDRIVERS